MSKRQVIRPHRVDAFSLLFPLFLSSRSWLDFRVGRWARVLVRLSRHSRSYYCSHRYVREITVGVIFDMGVLFWRCVKFSEPAMPAQTIRNNLLQSKTFSCAHLFPILDETRSAVGEWSTGGTLSFCLLSVWARVNCRAAHMLRCNMPFMRFLMKR